MIEGVVVKQIVRHSDERGYFSELLKSGESGFHKVEQTSYALTNPGIIKAFHHHNYWESWVVIRGEARVVLHDIRVGSKTRGQTQALFAGEQNPIVLSIPPGVTHGYQVLGKEPVGMLYHSEEAYDPKKKNQIEVLPFDSKEINFDWQWPVAK